MGRRQQTLLSSQRQSPDEIHRPFQRQINISIDRTSQRAAVEPAQIPQETLHEVPAR
jgi:hypothetical protein